MSEFTRPRGVRGGIGRGRMPGPNELASSSMAPSAGRTRAPKFRPNLSMAGKRIEASEQVAPSSHRGGGGGRSRDGGRGRGRAQRRGRGVVVAAEGIFSEGLSTSSPSSQLPSDLGRLSVKERCIQADPTETDEQALEDLLGDNKNVSDDDDVVKPIFVPSINAAPDSSVKFESLSELILKDQLEDRLILVRLPRALPYLLGWLNPIPAELQVREEMDIESADHVMAYLDCETDSEDDDEDEDKDKGEHEHKDEEKDESSDEDKDEVRQPVCYLDVHRSGKISMRFKTFTGNWIRLPAETRPSKCRETVCYIEADESDDEGTITFFGDTAEHLNCYTDEQSMSSVDYFIEM